MHCSGTQLSDLTSFLRPARRRSAPRRSSSISLLRLRCRASCISCDRAVRRSAAGGGANSWPSSVRLIFFSAQRPSRMKSATAARSGSASRSARRRARRRRRRSRRSASTAASSSADAEVSERSRVPPCSNHVDDRAACRCAPHGRRRPSRPRLRTSSRATCSAPFSSPSYSSSILPGDRRAAPRRCRSRAAPPAPRRATSARRSAFETTFSSVVIGSRWLTPGPAVDLLIARAPGTRSPRRSRARTPAPRPACRPPGRGRSRLPAR